MKKFSKLKGGTRDEYDDRTVFDQDDTGAVAIGASHEIGPVCPLSDYKALQSEHDAAMTKISALEADLRKAEETARLAEEARKGEATFHRGEVETMRVLFLKDNEDALRKKDDEIGMLQRLLSESEANLMATRKRLSETEVEREYFRTRAKDLEATLGAKAALVAQPSLPSSPSAVQVAKGGVPVSSTAPAVVPMPSTSTLFPYHKGVEEAVKLMWNNQFDDADRLLSGKKETNPRFALEHAHWWVLWQYQEGSAWVEGAIERYRNAEQIANLDKYDDGDDSGGDEPTGPAKKDKKQRAKEKEEHMKAVKEAKKAGAVVDESWQLECDCIAAEAVLFKGILQLFRGNAQIKGGVNIRKAWVTYQALLGHGATLQNDVAMCVKFGVGMIHLLVPFFPSSLVTILRLTIPDDDSAGVAERYFGECYTSNTLRSPFAAMGLLLLHLQLAPHKLSPLKARPVLEHILPTFPGNSYYLVALNFYHRLRGETAEAVNAMKRSIENTCGRRPVRLRCLLADALLADMQVVAARDLYSELVLVPPPDPHIPLCLAACCVLSGDDAVAMDFIKDAAAAKKGPQGMDPYVGLIFKEPRYLFLLPAIVLYVHQDLHAVKPDRILLLTRSFEAATTRTTNLLHNPDVKGLLLTLKAVMSKALQEDSVARSSFHEVIALGLNDHSVALGYAYYELAEMEARDGNTKRAKELLTKGTKMKVDATLLGECYATRCGTLLKILAKKS